MSLKNFVNKMQKHSHDMESKLSLWKTEKKEEARVSK